MISGTRSHRLADLTWPEVAAARAHAPVAAVPLGACEQHGYGLALRTDTTRAEVAADMIAEAMRPSVLVTPAIPVGVAEHHMAFPGTMTLSSATLRDVIHDVVTSLYRHGWRKVFVLTGHGGNNSTVDVTVKELSAEFADLSVAWSGITAMVPDIVAELADSPVRGHGCEIESSQALFSDPSLVHKDRLAAARADGSVHLDHP